MHLAHLVKGRRLIDYGITSQYSGKVKAVAKGLSTANSFAARPAFTGYQLWQLVGKFSLRDEFTLLAVISWIFLLLVKLEAMPMGRREPAEDMSDVRSAGSFLV